MHADKLQVLAAVAVACLLTCQQVARSPPCARSRTYSSLTARPVTQALLGAEQIKVEDVRTFACERIDRTRGLSVTYALGFRRIDQPKLTCPAGLVSLGGSGGAQNVYVYTFRYATLAVHACLSLPFHSQNHACSSVCFLFDSIGYNSISYYI
jgi:hypothetical protein